MPAYSSTGFPDIRGQSYSRSMVFRTVRSTPDRTTAGDLARALVPVPMYRYRIAWTDLSFVDMSLIHEATVMLGSDPWARMVFFEWLPSSQTEQVFVEEANGIENTFDCPVKESENLIAYINGTPTAYVLSPSEGPNTEDRVTFGLPPAAGSFIHVTYDSGRRRVSVIQDEDAGNPRFSWSARTLRWSTAVGLMEVPEFIGVP